MSRTYAPSLLALAVLAGCSCGGPPEVKLTISAPAQVQLTSTATATITVAGLYDGSPIIEGETITLETDLGRLLDASTTCQEMCEGTSSVNLQVVAGKVRATLKPDSGNKPGTSTITARYVDPYAREVTATAKVEWVAKKVASLQFYCNIGGQRMIVGSIGAFVQRGEEIQVPCKAAGWDEDNHWVDSAKVKFVTEAGDFVLMESPPDEAERGQMFLYRPRAGGKFPRDVDPLGFSGGCENTPGEPCYDDPITHTRRNPRDGLATLVAYVAGDPLPGYEGEPYVDENDNNQYDEGEEIADLNKNGQWDDEQTSVQWKQIKILWTGELCAQGPNHACPASRIRQADDTVVTSLARGSSLTFKVVFLDGNLNIPSWNIVGDDFSIESDPAEPEVTVAKLDYLQRDTIGIDMEPNSSRLRYPTKRESYGIASTYLFSVTNARKADEELDPAPLSLAVTLEHTYTLDESGTGGATLTETLTSPIGVTIR